MAESRGFFSSSSSSGSTSSRAASATPMTYQPFLLVARIFEPSRLKGPGEKLSGSGVFSFSSRPASSGDSSAFGLGVRLRGASSSRARTKISPFCAYANIRPSSDHRSRRPFRSLAGAMMRSSVPAPSRVARLKPRPTYKRSLSVPLMTS